LQETGKRHFEIPGLSDPDQGVAPISYNSQRGINHGKPEIALDTEKNTKYLEIKLLG